MEFLEYLLLVLVGFGSGFVQRVSGFGLGIFAMLFLPHFMPNHTAAAVVACLLSCSTTTFNALKFRKAVAYKTVIPMTVAALVTIPIAVYFSSAVSARIFKILLGTVLVLLSLYFIFLGKRVKLRPTLASSIFAGSLSGVLGGLFSTSGPPAVLYLTNATTENVTYFATVQFYFCITNLYTTATRAISGMIDLEMLLYSAVGIIGCMAGDFLGSKVFKRLNGEMLKKVIYVGMIISGVIMFL